MSSNSSSNQTTVAVLGLGFVGSAMSVAVAKAVNEQGTPYFNVTGIDLANEEGKRIVSSLNRGVFPFENSDTDLDLATAEVIKSGNFTATTDKSFLSQADIIVLDIGISLDEQDQKTETVTWRSFKAAIKDVADHMKENALVLVETTVPPGTCDKVVKPILCETLAERSLATDRFMLAHSYERVMPGRDYLSSINNFYRCFAGMDQKSADACEAFLSKVINVSDFPLSRLSSMVASETSKVLENSYRAMTIAFMEEWGRFAERAGFDLFEVINAIRKRDTHSNIRQPGFGVGGYCLTKDPLFARIGAHELFEFSDLEFPLCEQAVQINNKMPLVSVDYLSELLGDLKNKKILLCGVSYRQDVGDTRYSPSEVFYKAVTEKGGLITAHDPLVPYWNDLDINVHQELPQAEGYDAIVFAVPHAGYHKIDFANWLSQDKPLIFDANNVLSETQLETLKRLDCPAAGIGRGEI